ncbi:hypothetical protein ACWKSP_18955 [Micromonosporaceae bacterium Da 78-11]
MKRILTVFWPRRPSRPRPAAQRRLPVSRFGRVVVLTVERDPDRPRPGHAELPVSVLLGRRLIDRARRAIVGGGRP